MEATYTQMLSFPKNFPAVEADMPSMLLLSHLVLRASYQDPAHACSSNQHYAFMACEIDDREEYGQNGAPLLRMLLSHSRKHMAALLGKQLDINQV